MGTYAPGTPIEIEDTFYLSGVPTDPTTVTYTVTDPNGDDTDYVFGVSPQVTNPAVGNYLLSLDPPAFAGIYQYEVVATGAVEASRQGTFTVLGTNTDVPALSHGPCQPWTDSQSVWDCCGQPMTTIGEGSDLTECAVDMTVYALEASEILFELSGRQFAGICSQTVRPCATTLCGFQTLSRGYVVWPADWFYGGNWGWQNGSWSYPKFAGCGCKPLSRVLLPGYPVREITAVTIDGADLPQTVAGVQQWRLDENRFLTRMGPDANGADNTWPACQALNLPATETGTWEVEYTFGQEPPLIGQHAAQQLGCELYKACAGQDCALPAGTTRITRQGVTIDKLATLSWAYERRYGTGRGMWRTGLSAVDVFLNSFNATGMIRRPTVWSPAFGYARRYG